jgi:HlyD family secretion protein
MNRFVWLLVVLAAVVVVGLLVYAQATDAVPVLTARVESGPIREFIDERGKTRLPRTYLITQPFTARIEEIDLFEGTAVKRGQVVARIVPTDLQLSVDASEAAVERLDAAILENDDTTVEKTGLQQAIEFVKSMDRTVDAALARVESGKAKKDFAQKQLQRQQSLVAKKAAPQDDLDRAEFVMVESRVDLQQDELVHSAMVSLQAATALMPTMVRQYIGRKDLSHDVLVKQRAEAVARLQQVQQDQQRGTLISPVDGVVLARHVTNERYISAGTVLMEIGRLEDLEVEAEVLSQDVVDVKLGNEVEIYGPAIGDPPARGVVTRIYPAGFTKISSLGVEQQRVMVVMKMNDDDLRRMLEQRGLGVDYRVRVRIYTQQKSRALTLPRSALFRGGNGDWQVFVVRRSSAQRVPLKLGLMNDNIAEVVKGLEEGETVVLAPESGLTDGQRVKAE